MAVLQVLQPILNDIKDDLALMKSDLSHLNESVNEHRNQTASSLADINTSLQRSGNNPPTDEISAAVLLKLLPYMNDITDSVGETESNLERKFEEEMNQTTSKLALSLHSAANGTSEQLMQLCDKTNTLDSELASVNAHISANFSSLESQVFAKIDWLNNKLDSVDSTASRMSDDLRCVTTAMNSLNESVIEQSRCLKEHKNETKSELVNVNVALDSIHTLVRNKFSFIEESNNTDLVNLDEQNFTKLLNICSSCLPMHTCGDTRGWRQVVHLDMTDNRTKCPEGWNMTDYSKRTCGRASEGESLYASSCDSITYPVCGEEYSQVCGRIKAYQYGWTAAFPRIYNVDKAYFSGVAVMHGSPRQHIWTFAAGAAENNPGLNGFVCPCDVHYISSVPSFVGDDYFCESEFLYKLGSNKYTFHSNDTLWDGKDCHSSSTCCSLSDPPFFSKTLSTPTTDDLELRMCLHQSISRMNIAVKKK